MTKLLASVGKLLLICIWIQMSTAYDYKVLLLEEEIFSKCDDYPNDFIDKIVDISNVTYDLLNNGSIHAYGHISLKDAIMDSSPINARVYKRQRDEWISTIYHVYRPDFCRALFNPTDYYYSFIKSVPVENRTCPISKNLTVDVNVVADNVIPFLPDKHLAGEYKVIVNLGSTNNMPQYLCFLIYMELVLL